MSSRDFVEKLVAYLKENRSKTLKEKCKDLGLTAQTYYLICKRHRIDGRIGPKTSIHNEKETLELMNNILGSSNTSGCTPSRDNL